LPVVPVLRNDLIHFRSHFAGRDRFREVPGHRGIVQGNGAGRFEDHFDRDKPVPAFRKTLWRVARIDIAKASPPAMAADRIGGVNLPRPHVVDLHVEAKVHVNALPDLPDRDVDAGPLVASGVPPNLWLPGVPERLAVQWPLLFGFKFQLTRPERPEDV